MGFIKNMLGKSLFTDDSYYGAIGRESTNEVGYNPGYAVIILQPSIPRSFTDKEIEPTVKGIIKDKLDLNYTAHWSDMGGFGSIVQGVPFIGDAVAGGKAAVESFNSVIGLGGGAQLGAVYSSRKIYQKSGYVEISPSFRVVDWQGNGDPLKAAFCIASYCSPLEGETNLVDTVINWLKEKIESGEDKDDILSKAKTLVGVGGALATSFVTYIEKNFEKFAGQAGTNLINNITEDIKKDYFSIRSAPVPLTVTIGQYFWHPDMVLTNASISFSKEMTRNGPLYVDINLSLSSRKIIGDVADIGIQRKAFRLIEMNVDQDELNFARI